MARLIAIFALVLFSGTRSSFGAPSPEESVVRAMVAAAGADQLDAFLRTVDLPRITASSRGQCTPESLVAIGKLLSRPGVTFETQRRGDACGVRATTRDRITALFSFRSLNKTRGEPDGRLVIAAVDIRLPDSTR